VVPDPTALDEPGGEASDTGASADDCVVSAVDDGGTEVDEPDATEVASVAAVVEELTRPPAPAAVGEVVGRGTGSLSVVGGSGGVVTVGAGGTGVGAAGGDVGSEAFATLLRLSPPPRTRRVPPKAAAIAITTAVARGPVRRQGARRLLRPSCSIRRSQAAAARSRAAA
jgi:hypothetical protein